MSESGLPLDHGGMIDRWQRIWAPHREAYLRGEGRPAHDTLSTFEFFVR